MASELLDKAIADGHRVLILDQHEYGLIVSGLRRLRIALSHEMRRSKAKGFVPAPGRNSVPEMRMRTLVKLTTRLGISTKGE